MTLSPLGWAALSLSSEFGLPVFPCAPRTKRAMVGRLKHDGTLWKEGRDTDSEIGTLGGFHRASTHPEQVSAWWERWPDANIGVRLGGVLRLGLIEGDTPSANERIESMAATWAPTWAYRSSRGINRIVRVPVDIADRPVRNVFEDEIGAGLEVKTGRGLFVAPPSIHPKGIVYEWCEARSPADCALSDMPFVIAEEIRRLDAARLGPKVANGSSGAPRAHTFDPVCTLDALRFIDPDDYQTWRDVGLALKYTGHPSARGIWDAWSAGSRKFDEQVNRSAWIAFRPTAITLASVFHHARSAGWSARRAS